MVLSPGRTHVRGVRAGPRLGYAMLLGILTLTACRPGVPSVAAGPKPAHPDGTISGTVRGPENARAIDGRIVDVVNVDTGERQRDSTSSTGGFTFKLKPGNYRVELMLHDGESLIEQPGVIDLKKTDLDARADFMVSVVRTSRPRQPGASAARPRLADRVKPTASDRRSIYCRACRTPGCGRRPDAALYLASSPARPSPSWRSGRSGESSADSNVPAALGQPSMHTLTGSSSAPTSSGSCMTG